MESSVKELQNKFESLELANINLNLKLDSFSSKETEQIDIIKCVLKEMKSLKKNNEAFLNIIQDIKNSNRDFIKRFDALENRVSVLEEDKVKLNKELLTIFQDKALNNIIF